MGDRLATVDMGRKLRGLCPPFYGGRISWVPSNNVAWADAYLRTKWYLDPSSRLATTDMGRKFGGGAVSPFWKGELSPHLTQCCLGRGLPPYQVASWSIQRFGHNRYGPKIGEGCVPFGEGKLSLHLTQYGQGRSLPACQVSP